MRECLENLLKFSFLALLVVGLLIPSGMSHGIFHPKGLLFSLTLLLFILNLMFTGEKNIVLCSFAGVVFILFWYVIGRDNVYAIDQMKIVALSFYTPLMGLYLVQRKSVSFETLFKAVIYLNTCYCVLKLALIGFQLLHFLDVGVSLKGVGIRFMSMAMVGNLGRLHTSLDTLTPFLLFFVLRADTFGKKFKVFYLIVSLIATLFSFSRVLFFCYGLSVALYFYTLPLRKQLISIFIIISALTWFGMEKVARVVDQRVTSVHSVRSDQVRWHQIRALQEECESAPLLGHGWGYYAPACQRDSKFPYSYEVQWMALWMQLGVVGLGFLSLPLLFLGCRLFVTSKQTFILFLAWLSTGFFNPFLLSLTSGIFYCFLLCYKLGARHASCSLDC